MSANPAATLLLHVLGFESDGMWHALCLEMDLVGTGDTFDEAYEDLQQIIDHHVAFAKEKNEPGALFFPAEAKYFKMFAEQMGAAIFGMPEKEGSNPVRSIAIPTIAA